MPPTDRFARFAAAVHRRAVVVRVVEGFGAGVAVGAVFALFAVLISFRTGVNWWPVGLFAAFPVVFSTLHWWKQRPTRLAAVMEADRQLKLDDLLSSALVAGDDDFGHAVRAMAERACVKLSPSQVMLNRWGVRAWGGVGLAWAMVIVLGLLVGNADTRAGEDSPLATTSTSATRRSDETGSAARHLPGHERGVDEPRGLGEGDTPTAGSGKSAPGAGTDTNQANTGTGGGTAKSGSTAVESPGTGSTTGQPTGGTETSAGVGRGAPGRGDPTGGTGASADRQATPWRSDQWPAARAAALQAVHDGRVPDAYRDVVREYFRQD